jgi:hypothetical protein
LKVLATRRYPGPALGELGDVEIGKLEPRDDVEALLVANEPVDVTLFPSLRLVANFGSATTGSGSTSCGAMGCR